MKARATVIAVCIGALLLPSAWASSTDEVTRRAAVPNTRAKAIAASLFPQECGDSGNLCGIIYGPEFCPLQFAITFPRYNALQREGAVAWVTVDPRGNVVEVSFSPSKECRKGNGIAS